MYRLRLVKGSPSFFEANGKPSVMSISLDFVHVFRIFPPTVDNHQRIINLLLPVCAEGFLRGNGDDKFNRAITFDALAKEIDTRTISATGTPSESSFRFRFHDFAAQSQLPEKERKRRHGHVAN